jgi:DNA-binding transcriptional MerR regulator
MARAAEIAALRALGLSLAQVARVLGGNPQDLEPALAAHQERLEEQVRQTTGAIVCVKFCKAGRPVRRAKRLREAWFSCAPSGRPC